MKAILEQLFNNEALTTQQAKEVLFGITNNQFNDAQITAFMTVYLMRPISVEELLGFREAIMQQAQKINFNSLTEKSIDLCGTGGDGKNTFNISTTASFIVAGAGYKVVKHGNYGVSSTCGSSNVLEALGYNFTNNESVLMRQLEKTNICFLHAPLFHPALKSVAHIRKSLGVKTFFNLLGPLVNPSSPSHQFSGVFSLKMLRPYEEVFRKTKTNFSVVHSIDGYDEISLTGSFKIHSNNNEKLYQLDTLGIKKLNQEDIYGGNTIEENLSILQKILSGKGTESQNKIVTTNAAFAIKTIEQDLSLEECIEKAELSLMKGHALQQLTKLLTLN